MVKKLQWPLLVGYVVFFKTIKSEILDLMLVQLVVAECEIEVLVAPRILPIIIGLPETAT